MAAGSNLTTAGYGDALSSPQLQRLQLAINSQVHNKTIASHPVIMGMLASFLGVIGAVSARVGVATFGTAKAAATSEGSAASFTNYSVSNVTVSPARYAFARKASDDFNAAMQGIQVSGVDLANVDVMAADGLSFAVNLMVAETAPVFFNTVVDLIVAQLTNGTITAGTSAAALTWADVQELSVRLMAAGAPGPYLGLLSLQQIRDLIRDTESVTGAAANSALLSNLWQGGQSGPFIGTICGIDWHFCGELDDDGTDVIGGVISPAALGFMLKRVDIQITEGGIVLNLGAYTVQIEQEFGTGIAKMQITTHPGVTTLQAGAMCKISSRVGPA
ncbi:MAG: hypothetical protein EBR73_13050 [Rhodobacteraceae bacterium]|jgi:hypothetical protein|nr:hypothetical protein [Paracoccaceae bacterium]